MTIPEIDAEIARLEGEIAALTFVRHELFAAQIEHETERALATPEVREAWKRTLARIDLEAGRGPATEEQLDMLARNNPIAGAALICHFRLAEQEKA